MFNSSILDSSIAPGFTDNGGQNVNFPTQMPIQIPRTELLCDMLCLLYEAFSILYSGAARPTYVSNDYHLNTLRVAVRDYKAVSGWPIKLLI